MWGYKPFFIHFFFHIHKLMKLRTRCLGVGKSELVSNSDNKNTAKIKDSLLSRDCKNAANIKRNLHYQLLRAKT